MTKFILMGGGLLLALGGVGMLLLTKTFGSGGIMDRFRRDKGGEAFFFSMIVIDALLIG